MMDFSQPRSQAGSQAGSQPRWLGLRLPDTAFSWVEIIDSDLGCRAVHWANIIVHGLVMCSAFYGFASCGIDLGFDAGSCTSNHWRIMIPFLAFAVGMIIIQFLQAMLGRFKKLEERDTTQSNYSRRPSHFGFTSLMLFSNFAIIVIDFHMTRKAWGLTHGRWFHLKMLGFIEMMAGSVTCISVVLYGLKMRRVRRQGDEESEVLAALDEYADDPEEV